MDNVVRLIPKKTVVLEPKVTVDFEIEFIDNTGDVIIHDEDNQSGQSNPSADEMWAT